MAIAKRRRRIGPAFAMILVAVALASCLSTTTACPSGVEDARDDGYLASLDPATFVGIARVVRFVQSPDAEFRGYDLNALTTFHGSATTLVRLLRVREPLPGISPGDQVLVIAGTESASVLVPRACPVLQRLPRDT